MKPDDVRLVCRRVLALPHPPRTGGRAELLACMRWHRGQDIARRLLADLEEVL